MKAAKHLRSVCDKSLDFQNEQRSPIWHVTKINGNSAVDALWQKDYMAPSPTGLPGSSVSAVDQQKKQNHVWQQICDGNEKQLRGTATACAQC